MGQFYVVDVAGDWANTTLRARRVLCEAALILAHEPSRMVPLLAQAGAAAPLLDLAACDVSEAMRAVLDALEAGDVAWISPGLTRWGKGDEALLDGILGSGVEVLPVPGHSALIACLLRAGLPADHFSYLGELPPSSRERTELLRRVAYEPFTLACTVQGVDLSAAAVDIETVLGSGRRVTVCWEDGAWRGLVGEARAWLASLQGAPAVATDLCHVFVEGTTEREAWTEEQVRQEVSALLAQGTSARDAVQAVAGRSGWRRRAIYRIVVEMSQG